MIAKRIEELAARFWEDVGEQEPFPRDLELTIHLTKPAVAVVPLLRLRPGEISAWLGVRGYQLCVDTNERWLDGCLYASKGIVFLFVEETLEPERRRVAIAHEFGHFLADYEQPRRRAERRLGPALLPVLDGERLPTPAEQLAACLADVAARPHVHFMDRTKDGAYVEPVSEAERTADDLALELLAPWREVLKTGQAKNTWPANVAGWQDGLERHFGLPRDRAKYYAAKLWRLAQARRSFSETLGM